MNIAKYITLIIVILFIILGVSMFLVGKYIKKKSLKIISVIIISLITLWTVMFAIDINRTNTIREPIFARENGNIGSMTKYVGLGYRIGLEKDLESDRITKSQMTIFGQLVAGAIQDFVD